MSLFFPFIAISSVRHPTGSNGRSAKKRRIIFRLVEKRYHRCHSVCLLQLFHTRGSSEAQEKRNQLFGTAHNLLTHFEWANADEEVFMCLLKEVSVIVARRVLFKRIIFRCQLPQNKKKETNTEQCRLQSSLAVEHRRKHLKNCYAPHLLEVDYMRYLLFFSAVHILLSITAFLTNSLILVALQKESSLHPPSKLLYRSLATTDLLVGLVAQPLYATYWMSLVQEHWSHCRYAFDAAYITGSASFLASLMTMAAIGMDRLLALLSGRRYKQIVTLRRTYIIVATIWIRSLVSSFCAFLDIYIYIYIYIIYIYIY